MDDNAPDLHALVALLHEAGLTSYPRGSGVYAVLFSGALRPWTVDVRTSNGWLCLRTQVMTLPKAETARTAVLDAVSRINDRVPLCKFAIAWTDQLVLDAQYLMHQVDAQVLSRLVWLVESIAEREYASLLDVARSSEALDGLEAAYKRSSAA